MAGIACGQVHAVSLRRVTHDASRARVHGLAASRETGSRCRCRRGRARTQAPARASAWRRIATALRHRTMRTPVDTSLQ